MKKIKLLVLIATISLGLGTVAINSQVNATSVGGTAVQTSAAQYISVNPLSVVAAPSRYLYKSIKIQGKFDKFSTLGLDYPPAMRNSDKYISFLIQRPDVSNHNVPLSEFKIFLKKEIAEKHIDLDAGDEIVFTGKVFSTALGDPWMDVDNLTVLTPKKKTEKPKTEQK